MPSGQDVAAGIAGLFTRYSILGIERRIRELESGAISPAKDRAQYVLQSRFLTRRAHDPRFAANVDAASSASLVEKKNRAVIAPAVIRSLLSGDPITLETLLGTKLPDGEKYTRKQIQNLRDGKYASLFRQTEPGAAEDQRLTKMLTVATPADLPATPETPLALAEHFADRDRHSADEDDFMAAITARMTDGRRQRRFSGFRILLEREMTNPERRNDTGFQESVRYLRPNPVAQEILFNHLESVFASEWFRSKSTVVKEHLLTEDQRPAITPAILADAIRAARIHLAEEQVRGFLLAANRAWFDLGFPEEAAVIVSHLLSKEFRTAERVRLIENLATDYLYMGQYGEAIRALSEAGAIFEKIGDRYNGLIAKKNVAEALFAQGHAEQAASLVSRIRSDALALPQKDRFHLAINLANLHARVGQTRKALELVSEVTDLADSPEGVLLAGQIHSFIDAMPENVPIGPRAWRRLAKMRLAPGRRLSGRDLAAMERRVWDADPAFKVTGDISGERGRNDTSTQPKAGAEEAEKT